MNVAVMLNVFRQDMMDYVFTLADGQLLHLEFQSTAEKKLHRFLLYDTLLAQKTDRTIRTVILYENQITTANDTLDIGSAQYHVGNIYLAHKDVDQAFDRIRHHLDAGTFTLEDRFDLAFALHMRRSRSLEDMVRQSMELIQQIPDNQERSYVAAIFVELGTRWLDDNSKQQIRKWVERVDIVKEIVEEAILTERQETLARLARSWKQKGKSEKDIADLLDTSIENVQDLLKK